MRDPSLTLRMTSKALNTVYIIHYSIDYVNIGLNSAIKRSAYLLDPGCPTSHERFRLVLLRSRPDTVHRFPLRETGALRIRRSPLLHNCSSIIRHLPLYVKSTSVIQYCPILSDTVSFIYIPTLAVIRHGFGPENSLILPPQRKISLLRP